MDSRPAWSTIYDMSQARPRFTDLLVLGAAATWVIALLVIQTHYAYGWGGIDLGVYLRGGQAVRDGEDLYGSGFSNVIVMLNGNSRSAAAASLPFTYPPFAALLFAPLSCLSFGQAWLLITAFGIGSGYVIASILASRYGSALGFLKRRNVTLVATAVLLVSTASFDSMRLGQVSLPLAALVMLDLHRKERRLFPVGVLVGIAAAVKILPGVIVVYWLLTRQWRQASVAVSTVGVLWGVAALALPGDSLSYFTTFKALNARGQGDGNAYNLSFINSLGRLTGNAPGMVTSIVVAALVLITASAAALSWRRAGDNFGAGLTMFAAVSLASPIGWVHYTVWALPLLVAATSRMSVRPRRMLLAVSALLLSLPFRHPGLVNMKALWPLAIYLVLAAALAVGLKGFEVRPDGEGDEVVVTNTDV